MRDDQMDDTVDPSLGVLGNITAYLENLLRLPRDVLLRNLPLF
jgi:hypothetical protein